jgi:hypothetical protein
MKNLKKELDDRYGKKSIEIVEQDAISAQSAAYDIQKSFYEILYYLKLTGRYRENSRYKKAPWEIYLRDMFKMSAPTYRNMVEAFFSFPKESEELGPGLVTTIKQKCGKKNMAVVLAKVMKIPKKTRTHPKIEEIVDNNLLPLVSDRIRRIPYSLVVKENIRLKSDKESLIREVVELKDRISKLLNTVSSFRDDFNFETHNVPAEVKRAAAMV